MADDLCELSAGACVRGVRDGTFSAVEVAAAYLRRIEDRNPAVGAYLSVLPERVTKQAREVDAARARGGELGPLAGAAIALKDIFVTQGVETTGGSKILAGWIPPYHGTHAARLDRAGALTLGKVTMDEFAMGSSNENTPHTVPRNPWAPDYVAGGSSGGSAAAVAGRLAAASLGTDTGGSIRQPASLCNLVGLKPTYGRVSRFGMIAFASSLDQAGPLTRDAEDAALVLRTIAGRDVQDATSLDDPVPDYVAAVGRGVAGLRIGLDRDLLERHGLEPGVRGVFEQGLRVLTDAGARLVDVELPHFKYAVATYYVLSAAEASSNLARYDGVRYGLREPGDTLDEMYRATREAGFGAEVKRRILLGTFVLRKDSYEAYYGRAQRVRTLIARDYDSAFEKCDVIASPASPIAGFRRGEKVDDPLTMYLSDVYTIGANLAGLPAISIPAGFTTVDGASLPVGMQLIGRRLDEEGLLAAAGSHQRATDWHRRRPQEVS